MRTKTVIFLTNQPLNEGQGASSVRILEYSKGLIFNRDDVIIYLCSLARTNHTFSRVIDFNRQIIITGESNILDRNYFANKYLGVKQRKKTFNEILNIYGGSEDTIFILYPFFNTWYEEKKYIKWIKMRGYKVYSERNERSYGIFLNKTKPKVFWKFLISLLINAFEYFNTKQQDKLVKYYDGNLVISENFRCWIEKRNSNYLKIPILSDRVISNSTESKKTKTFEIGYFGSLNPTKDGLIVLLKSIKILVQKYKLECVLLNIYGYGNTSETRLLKATINKFNISLYAKFQGAVSNQKAKIEQRKHNLLVLLRPSNLQTTFGFSTKLAEYAHSGVPILLTDVSDNKLYLRDRKEAFYTEFEPDNIASSIYEIYSLDEEVISKVVENSKIAAQNYFSIQRYAKQLQEFIGI